MVLLQQHIVLQLPTYQSTRKRHWPSNIKQALSRRLYLYREIEQTASRIRRAMPQQAKLKEAAQKLDAQRRQLNLTMPKYHDHLKKADPATKKRKRSQDPANDGQH